MKILRINTADNTVLGSIKARLNGVSHTEVVAVFINCEMKLNVSEEDAEKFIDRLESDVMFGASASFPFTMKGINLYYWKYYPRKKTPYSFLYPKAFIGTVGKIESLLDELSIYEHQEENNSFFDTEYIDPFQRFYVDSLYKSSPSKLSIAIDHDQQIFGVSSGRESMYKWPFINERHASIFYQYEKAFHTKSTRLISWDMRMLDGEITNVKTHKQPLFTSQRSTSDDDHSILKSFQAYAHSCFSLLKVGIFNLGKRPDYKIFRYASNHGAGMKDSIDKIVDLLQRQVPFSFAHFNDGELTFIKKFITENHKETWFGRRQNKYNKVLGDRLFKALTLKKENYFVGIPCEKCHPRLNKMARDIRVKDEFTIPAMTLHHNLNRFPEILNLLKDRKIYFVVNESQDLSFFDNMGLNYDESSIIKIPFKNSHNEYEKLVSKTFDEGSVVMMMCGMLAKILSPAWFDSNPKTTFITFGSAFDDYIQKNISFNLYPEKIPYSKSLIGSRFFLFGYKRKCEKCYDIKEENKTFLIAN